MHYSFGISVVDGQDSNGQYVQSTQYGTIYSSGQGFQQPGTQYGNTAVNTNSQNLQYDQPSDTLNNQQSYPNSQQQQSYNTNTQYATQQNQVGYNTQSQQSTQNQYLNNGQVQSYSYDQQNQPAYNTQQQYSYDQQNQPAYNTQQQTYQDQYFNNGQAPYSNSQQPNLYGLQYDAGSGQTQYGQPSGNQQYNNGQTQNALYGSVGSSSGDTQVQILDYSFTNGNCKFENGYVTENGQQRQATQQDMATVAQYKQALSDYMKQINSNMGDWVSGIFKTFSLTQQQNFPTVPSLPAAPQVPCLCSPQNCGTSQQPQQNIAYDPSNQYGQQGNQYMQNVPQNNNQYQSNSNQMQYQNGAQQVPLYNGRRK
ncbi:unnamed protein product [Haemonchus placei]|uniref:Prion protein n=1 Tax=Haemonchus placei TaxID=6290 RepID=A0A0N4W7M9_HAEPC|nr:unnamed protein product [Haemonchus placei]